LVDKACAATFLDAAAVRVRGALSHQNEPSRAAAVSVGALPPFFGTVQRANPSELLEHPALVASQRNLLIAGRG
jgi:hypothetical protein